MDGGSSQPDRLPLILAIIAVVGVVGIGAYLLGASKSDEKSSRTGETTPRVPAEQKPKTSTKSAPQAPKARLARWPRGTNAYTVVLASTSERQGAVDAALRARGVAGDPGVLNSSDYATLRTGYWVAFAGVYPSGGEANANATTLRGRGFDDAYVRFVARKKSTGTAPPQPSATFFTVVIASEPSRARAQKAARRAGAAGLATTGVLNSDDYSSLRRGYWVAYVGRYETLDAASTEARRVRAAGFGDAYPRRVAR